MRNLSGIGSFLLTRLGAGGSTYNRKKNLWIIYKFTGKLTHNYFFKANQQQHSVT